MHSSPRVGPELVLYKLANSKLNVDRYFALVFCSRTDLRDERPLMLPLKLIFASDEKASRRAVQHWRSADILNKATAEPAAMAKTRDLLNTEDCDAESAPGSCETVSTLLRWGQPQ